MIRRLYLFQRELDDDPQEIDRRIIMGRRMNRSEWLLGRCLRCGAHITTETQFCVECLCTQYCDCRDCTQVASLHRMLVNDLFWSEHKGFEDRIYKYHLIRKIERMLDTPCCGEVAA